MRLAQLLEGIEILAGRGRLEVEVGGLAYDSRRVEPGDVFFALKGEAQDGHDFIEAALGRGAAAVVGQSASGPAGADLVRVADSRLALALASHRFFGRPTERLRLAGVTGTSGKTTTAYALEAILQAAALEVGVVGTVNYRYRGRDLPAPVTTPQSLDLVRFLAEMVEAGVEAAVMEVTSHALIQRRVSGCRFEAVAFTNLSRDHLDYHADMEDYFQAKRLLFTEHGPQGRMAVNLDDPYGRRLKEELGGKAVGFGLGPGAEITARRVELNGRGVRAEVVTPAGSFRLDSPLLGEINLLNLLTATALSWLLGLPLEAAAEGLGRLKGVPGRMEDVGRPFGRRVIVDYSHKVEALSRVLAVARGMTPGRIITVFGCGGDRDRGKRPLMARAAAAASEIVIVTSDNPRSEDPLAIMAQIEAGFEGTGWRPFPPDPQAVPQGRGRYTLVQDRRAAIRLAVSAAGAEDTVMICGKGHEDYQIVGSQRLHLDDREEAVAALREVLA